jgi:hypothetical protein
MMANGIRLGREAPLPAAMQGRWIVQGEPASELVISDGEVACFGAVVDYDYKEISFEDGALIVALRADEAEDGFSRSNITDLVVTPEGDLLGYNLKFGYQFLRAAEGCTETAHAQN